MALSKGILAVIDQGVVSLGNFATSIFLARTLNTSEYGHFAVLFGMMVLLNSVHAAFLLYPLMVDGAVAESNRLGALIGSRLGLTICLFVLEIPLLKLSLAHGSIGFLGALQVGAALLFWQMQETCRRGLLARFRFGPAIVGDVISYAGQIVALLLLWHFQCLSFVSGFDAIAGTSLAGFVFQASWVGARLVSRTDIWRALVRSYELGRWPAISFFIMAAQTVPLYTWILGRLATPADAAGFQALGNIVGITHPVVFSIATVIIPLAARMSTQENARKAWALSVRSWLRFASVLIPGYLTILLLPRFTLRAFYGSASAYISLAPELRILCLAYVVNCFVQLGYAFLLGMERPKIDLLANIFAASSAALVLVLGSREDMIPVCALAMLVSISVRAIILMICSIRISRSQPVLAL